MQRPIVLLAVVCAVTACLDSGTPTSPANEAPVASLDLSASLYDCSSQTEISSAECVALVALFESTGGADWNNNTNWLVTAEPCGWYGVGCFDGLVTHVGLNSNGLSGSIPPEVGNLTNLTYLGLGDNQLSDSIPSELGNLGALTGVHLFHNQLTGSIPPQLGNLTNLVGIQAGGNQLSGSIPPELGNLGSLVRLNFGYNQLSGSIPPALGKLGLLEELHLQSNELSGAIPPELGDLANLRDLEFYSNQLSGAIPATLGKLTSMERLLLGDNQLTGQIPPELGNLTKLRGLELYENQLTGPIPASLGNLALLEALWLVDNDLSGLVPLGVATLGGALPLSEHCAFVPPGNDGLYIVNTEPYRAADQDGDGVICGLAFSEFIPIAVDIKPGGVPNAITLAAAGVLPVAILATDDFDPAEVDPSTVTLGDDDGSDTAVLRRRNGSLMAALADVDGDGDVDLIVHVAIGALVANGDLDANTTALILNGATITGFPVRGGDAVRIVP
jgi:Leucine-rich repeat (LRR) protein